MTAKKDLKKLIRDRQTKTGESYTAARAQLLRDRGTQSVGEAAPPVRAEAIVLKVNAQSARIRIAGEHGALTFRSPDVRRVVPGHVADVVIEKRWTWRGDEYASGTVEDVRVDVAKLGLDPLPLEGGELEDVANYSEPYEPSDPYCSLWRRLTAKPRPSFEFDGIAWGALPGSDPDDNPTCDAAELAAAGDCNGARELLMDVLCEEPRCIDAHAHLGNLAFDRTPASALVHYEIGVRIGELSLPPNFNGLLVWGRLYNRAFLRCLHGYGLCLWRLGRLDEAQQVFERILALNPSDHQGVRFCWYDLRQGRSWEEMQEHEGLVE